ncbi:MAG: DUF5666 domain-containing protein [Pseudomonadota bacterium]
MKAYLRAALLAFITSLSLTSIANPCDDGGIGGTGIALDAGGIGGTGISIESGGIGGTGISSIQRGIGGTGAQAQSGIGGTGAPTQNGMGGTGIVGVITGFGSICVNGLEVHYFTDTPVDLDGKQISSQDLSIGHVVAVEATGRGESLVAHEIHAYHQISGPITAIDNAGKKLKVMGQSVSANAGQLKGMQVGQWVNVSGLRNADGSVVASRIDQTNGQQIAQTVGNLTRKGNKVYLGGTVIEGLPKTAGNANTDALLTGVWNGKSLQVQDMKIGPVSGLLQKIQVFHLQGLASGSMAGGNLKLSGQQVGVTAQTKLSGNNANKSLAGKAIIVRGLIKDGKPSAQFIDLQPIKPELKSRHDPKPALVRPKASAELNEKKPTKVIEPQKSTSAETKNTVQGIKNDEKLSKSKIIDTVDSIETVEKIETVDRVEKVERIEKPEAVEKPEKIEKVEKIEKPEKIEKVEKIEKPEKIERADKIEKPERVEHVERAERRD